MVGVPTNGQNKNAPQGSPKAQGGPGGAGAERLREFTRKPKAEAWAVAWAVTKKERQSGLRRARAAFGMPKTQKGTWRSIEAKESPGTLWEAQEGQGRRREVWGRGRPWEAWEAKGEAGQRKEAQRGPGWRVQELLRVSPSKMSITIF